MNITNNEIGDAAVNYSKVEEDGAVGVNATKFNAFIAGVEFVLNRLQNEAEKDGSFFCKDEDCPHCKEDIQQMKDDE